MPLDIASICSRSSPTTRAKTGRTAHVFTAQRGTRRLVSWAAANGGVTNGGLRGVWPPFPEIGRNRPFSPFFCLFRPFPEDSKSTWEIQKTEEKGLFPQISSDLLKPQSLKPPFAALQLRGEVWRQGVGSWCSCGFMGGWGLWYSRGRRGGGWPRENGIICPFHVGIPPAPYRSLPGPSGPKSPKSLRKSLLGRPATGSKKCPKQSRKSLQSLRKSCFETPETFLRLFWTLYGHTKMTKITKRTQTATNKELSAGLTEITETTERMKTTEIQGANHGSPKPRV